MKCAVTITLVPEVRGGPFVFWDDLAGSIRQAAELGFHGVEIFPPEASAVDANRVRSLSKESCLQLAAMGTGAGWVKHRLSLTSPDRAVREKAEAFIASIIDTAGSLGAPAIIGSMQGRWGDGVSRETAVQMLGESVDRLGERAATHSVPLLYEPVNRYETNLFNTLGDASAFVDSLATKNVRLLADLFHMNMEEADIAAALRTAGKRIGHIHFVDSNRKPAGLGHIDYAPIAEALRNMGYDGFLSAEAFPMPNPLDAARQTIATFRKYFA
jgi:sugar phosphate isomerase/epimerase